MRIGVVGAGAVGGTIAALLDRAGHDVAVTARGEHLEAIRERGLRLSGAWGDHTARVAASTVLEQQPELAFVCVKAHDAAAALEANREALKSTTVVVVQNGLRAVDVAREALPNARCLGGLALFAASYLSAGDVTVTADGTTYLGAGKGKPTPATKLTAAVLNDAVPTIATDNFVGCQWSKLIVNHVNAMPAITGLSAQETIGDPGLRRIITASMRESVRVGLANGVHFGDVQGLSNALLRAFAVAPLAVGQVLPRLMAKRMGSRPNPGSTLQSLRRGQRTEIDFLNGAVVDAAARLGGAPHDSRDAAIDRAPINRRLTAFVHNVEETGHFMSRDDVLREVTL